MIFFRQVYDIKIWLYTKKLVAYIMFLLGWNEGGDTWNWRRQLFAWEEDMVVRSVGLCLTMLIYRLVVVIIDSGN
jgi:hypothetical protein